MNRIIYIDIAKAICIILVVIGHYSPENQPQWYAAINHFIYSFHMPLFLFASGFIFKPTHTDGSAYKALIIKKIKRLLVPYFTCSVIVITLKLLSQGNAYVENPVTALSYLKMFYLPEAGYFLWFIWALFTMFLITPLFKTRTARNWVFLASIILAYAPFTLPEAFCLNQFKRMYVYFMFGIFVRENNIGSIINEYSTLKMTVTSIMFAILEFIYLTTDNNSITANVVLTILPFIGIAFVIYVSQLICKHINPEKHSLLMSIAAASYTIYLFHTTFEGLAKAILMKIPFDDGLWYIFSVKACLVVMSGIVIPMVMHAVAKRFAATRFLLGLK